MGEFKPVTYEMTLVNKEFIENIPGDIKSRSPIIGGHNMLTFRKSGDIRPVLVIPDVEKNIDYIVGNKYNITINTSNK